MNLKEEASATMKHDDTPCSGDTREGWAWWKKSRAVSVAVLVFMSAFIVAAIMPKAGHAAASPCAIELHKQALSLAIEHAPRDLKNSVRVQEAPMHKRVAELQNSPAMAGDYRTAYNNVVALAAEGNRRKYPQMAEGLVDLSLFVFMRYRAPDLDKYCTTNDLAKQASFVYDGYDSDPNYGGTALSLNATGDDWPGAKLTVLRSLNTTANEIIDLWITVWTAAGRNTADQPETFTLVRGEANPPYLSFLSLEQAKALGRKAVTAGNDAVAEEVLTEVLTQTPEDGETIYELAVVQYKTKNNKASLANFRKVADRGDAPFYMGMLNHMNGDASTSISEQMKAYYESFILLSKVQKSSGAHAAEAEQMLRETATHLVELYSKALTDDLENVGRALKLAELSKSRSDQKEFEDLFGKVSAQADEYDEIRRITTELALYSGTMKDFGPAMDDLRKRGARLSSPDTARKPEPKKEAPVEKPKPVVVEKKAPPKPAPVEKKVEKPKMAEETARKSADAPAAVATESSAERYRKFYTYVKANDMVPVIDAFKAGYNGEACDSLRGTWESQFQRIVNQADASEWAERQQSYCVAGKMERDRGNKYYTALSEFLGSFEK